LFVSNNQNEFPIIFTVYFLLFGWFEKALKKTLAFRGDGLFGDGLLSHGLFGYGLFGYGFFGYGLSGHGLFGHGLSGHGLSGHGLFGHGLLGYGLLGYGLGCLCRRFGFASDLDGFGLGRTFVVRTFVVFRNGCALCCSHHELFLSLFY
jgi:hypothetical protein